MWPKKCSIDVGHCVKIRQFFFLFSRLQINPSVNERVPIHWWRGEKSFASTEGLIGTTDAIYENLDSPPPYCNVTFFSRFVKHFNTVVIAKKEKGEKRSPNVQLISSVASQQSIFPSHLLSNGRQEVSLPHWKCVSRLQSEKKKRVVTPDSIAKFYLPLV